MSPAEYYQHLFSDPQRAGVFHLPQHNTDALVDGAHAADCRVLEVDLGAAHDRQTLFDTLIMGLSLPDWFGRNWDALADCLQDMEWQPAGAYVLILRQCDTLQSSAPDDFFTLIELLADTADYWRAAGTPFWALVDMQADGIARLPTLPADQDTRK
jgi:RNAse (barnase) inhibitor barstar